MVALVWALVLSSMALGGDWTQFRGPGGRGISDEQGLPVKWGPAEGLRWKAELPGRGLSAPVIAGNKVFVTASSGYREGRLHVLCFDAATGRRLWERQFASTGNTQCHPKTCMAAPTPVTDGKIVYALFATADVIAFDADGNLLWYRSLAGDYPDISNQVGMAASPVLYRDVLLVPMENAIDSFLAGIDVKTGKNRWRLERAREINWITPALVAVNDRMDAVVQNGSAVVGLDPETGKRRWTSPDGLGPATVPSPVPGPEGVVLMPGRQLTALKPGPEGTTPEVLWRSSRLAGGTASPVYHQGRVYGLTSTGVNCLDAKTGVLAWQQRVPGPFSASPVVGDGKLYVVNEPGAVTVLQLGDKPEVLSVNSMGETLLATPAIAGGALYLRSDQHLFCVGVKK
jgi:outer membrane protein assembly factor BamB